MARNGNEEEGGGRDGGRERGIGEGLKAIFITAEAIFASQCRQ